MNVEKVRKKLIPNYQREIDYLDKIAKNHFSDAKRCQDYYINADKGNVEVMIDSYNQLLGNNDETSKKEAYGYLKRSADEGDKESMHKYGTLLEKGEVIEMNKEEACNYFKKSGHMGQIESLIKYAFMIRYGVGTIVNKKEALLHYEVAAKHNNTEGMYNAGMMLYYEEGVSMDREKAMHYFLSAAKLNHVSSMYQYAVYVDECSSDYNIRLDGLKYAQMAENKGHPNAYKYIIKLSFYILFHDLLIRFEGLRLKYKQLERWDISGFISIHDDYFDSYNRISNDYQYIIDHNWYINMEKFDLKYLRTDLHDNLTERMEYIRKYQSKIYEYIKYAEAILQFKDNKKKQFEIEYQKNNFTAIQKILEEVTNQLEKSKEFELKYNEVYHCSEFIHKKYYCYDILEDLKSFSDTLTKAQYETFCDSIYQFIEDEKKKICSNESSTVLSIHYEVERKIEQINDIYIRYDNYIKGKYYKMYIFKEKAELKYKPENKKLNYIKVELKYEPENVMIEISHFYESLTERIVSIESESICENYNAKKDIVEKIIESFKTIHDRDQTIKIVKRLSDTKQFSNCFFYPIDMIKVQDKYWDSPSIYTNPLYSDDHPPIICKDEDEFNEIIDNIYCVPWKFDKILGGGTIIKIYSQKITTVLNESKISFRSINALGIQRNQDSNSLFCLVMMEKIRIVNMYMRKPYLIIEIEKCCSEPVDFCLPLGSIIELPIEQQPMFIAETWSGRINDYNKISKALKWCCMNKTAKYPYSGFKLTPFIYVVPNKYSFDDWPTSDTWWYNIQPDLSKKISQTNYLWNARLERSCIQRIQRIYHYSNNDYLPAKKGGGIKDKLFKMLNSYRDYYIKEIECVVSNNKWADRNNAGNVMIHTNQFALVIYTRISEFKTESFFIEKLDDSLWDGDHYDYREYYSYHNYKSISCSNITVGELINGMRSDPNVYNSATYNSQDSIQFVLGALGITIPTFHSGSLIIPSLHELIEF